LPAATHIGGWGFFHGLGSTLRVGHVDSRWGMENASPSWRYSVSRHMSTNSRMTSSHIALVASVPGMPKPVTSRLPAPRPVPNSNRPSLRWSSMATLSATRAGWFTGGERLKMPEPRWMRSVTAAR
jgi:hypothetical protein